MQVGDRLVWTMEVTGRLVCSVRFGASSAAWKSNRSKQGKSKSSSFGGWLRSTRCHGHCIRSIQYLIQNSTDDASAGSPIARYMDGCIHRRAGGRRSTATESMTAGPREPDRGVACLAASRFIGCAVQIDHDAKGVCHGRHSSSTPSSST